MLNKDEVGALLREHDNFLVLTHARPDGDTMGTGAALCYGLNKMGRTAFLFHNHQFKDNHPWIAEPYLAPEGYVPDYVVSVDTASRAMLAEGFSGKVDLAIDHHGSNTGYAENTHVVSEKASCAEVLMDILRPMLGGFDKTIADLLYIAVSTDTGCFVYGNTSGDTLRAAAELCDAGASNTALNKILFRTSSIERLALEGMMYSTLRYYHDNKTIVSIVTREMFEKSGAQERDCADIAAIPGRVQGSATTVVIRELGENQCKLSVRTNGVVNASDLCAKFGGGGHAMAAGCTINQPVFEAEEQIVEAIAEALK